MAKATGQISIIDVNDITISTTPPANPSVGALWIDDSVTPNQLKSWNGSGWVLQSLSLLGLDPSRDADIGDAKTTLASIANDAILTVSERALVRDKVNMISGITPSGNVNMADLAAVDANGLGEVYSVRQEATNAGLASNHADVVNVESKYTNLVDYVNTLSPRPWNTVSQDDLTIVTNTWIGKWQDYYDAVNKLRTAIADKLKQNADDAENNAKDYVDANALIDGISVGGNYTGDFVKNQYSGATNGGEVEVMAGVFTHPNGNEYSISTHNVVTSVENGTFQQRYLAFVGSDLGRFTTSSSFLPIWFEDGQWKYDNNSTLIVFTPNENDCIVAKFSGTTSITEFMRYATKNNVTKSDLGMTAPLPSDITMDENGITATTSANSANYARLDYRGLYIKGGAIQIDGGLSDTNIASAGAWNTQGTYIDGTGVYTGTLNANQINAGTIDAARIQIGSSTTYDAGYDPSSKHDYDERLDNIVSTSALPYQEDLIIYGDSNKYYPVYIWGGNQNVLRTIKIWRSYSENPAPSDWYTSTHKGSIMLTWKGNFGGWGGANYKHYIEEHSSQYTELLGDVKWFDHRMGYIFFLRGGGPGGAIYHFASDQSLTNGYSYAVDNSPAVYYNGAADLVFDHTTNDTYDRYAEEPLTAVNTANIESITLSKNADAKAYADGVDTQLRTDLSLNAPLPTQLTLDANGITANADTGGYARFDYRGLYINGGAIQIDNGLPDDQIASSGAWNSAEQNAKDYMDENALIDGVSIGGFFNGTLYKNKLNNGTANDGEVQVAGTNLKFVHPNGNTYTLTSDKHIPTNLEGGITGYRYIMYGGTDNTRFNIFDGTSSPDFFPVIYENGQWKNIDNNGAKTVFTPNDNDCIVGKITKTSTTGGIDTLTLYYSRLDTTYIDGNGVYTGILEANQITVTGGTTKETNLLAGLSATGSGTGTVATDGNKNIGNSYLGFGAGNSTGVNAETDYIEYDLGAVYRIQESKAYFWSGDTRYYWYKIKYSQNGIDWFYAVGTPDNDGWKKSVPVTVSGATVQNPTVDSFSIPIVARYVRLYANGNTINTGNHIYEWEMFSSSSTSIHGDSIVTGTVTASAIAANTITATQIASDTITANKMKAGTITATSGIIANAAITTAMIKDADITTAKIKDANITTAKIANLAVDTAKIKDAAITNAKIANLAVGTANIADAAITNAKIGSLAVDTAEIANSAITNAKIANLAVDSAKIADASITTAKIANLAVESGKIKDAAITNAKIANAAITDAKIANATITNAKISDVSADKLTAGTIDANVITVTNLNANNISAGTLTANRLDLSDSANLNWNSDCRFGNEGYDQTVVSVGAVDAPTTNYVRQRERDGYFGSNFNVVGGEQFHVGGWCYNDDSSHDFKIGIRFTLKGGTSQWVLGATAKYDAQLSNAWVYVEGTVTAPSNAEYGQVFYQIDTFSLAGTWYYTKTFVRRASMITFDRAKGGTLLLGGENNGNGEFEVKEADQGLFAKLNATERGFIRELDVDDFSAPNVTNYNSKDLKYYVRAGDAASGSGHGDDGNDGSSWNSPLRTIGEAIRRLPKHNDGVIEIHLSNQWPFYEDIIINGFTGAGTISVYTRGSEVHGKVNIIGCTNRVNIDYVSSDETVMPTSPSKITYSGGNYVVLIQQCTYAMIKQQHIYGSATSTVAFGIGINDGTSAIVKECEIYDVNEAIRAAYGSHISVIDCKGRASRYGLHAHLSANVAGYGTRPRGDISGTREEYGGTVTGSWTENLGSASPPVVTTSTQEWASTGGSTWAEDDNAWISYSTSSEDVLQGRWDDASGSYGLNRGCWYFGTGINTTVAGKTIQQIRVYLERTNNSGYSNSQPITIRPHTHSSQPAGMPSYISGYTYDVSFARGEAKWITLPASFHAAFETGGAKGLMIYTTDTNNTRYIRMMDDAKIEITYST